MGTVLVKQSAWNQYSGASIKILRGKNAARNFSGGGGRPSKVLFYHFVQEHANFVLNCTQSWRTGDEKKIALPWRHHWRGFMFIAGPVHWMIVIAKFAMVRVLTCLTWQWGKGFAFHEYLIFYWKKKYYLKNYPMLRTQTHVWNHEGVKKYQNYSLGEELKENPAVQWCLLRNSAIVLVSLNWLTSDTANFSSHLQHTALLLQALKMHGQCKRWPGCVSTFREVLTPRKLYFS